MAEFLDLPTLIIIGVAVFVLLRLRSVLGTRTGNERPPRDRSELGAKKQESTVEKNQKIVTLRPREREDESLQIDRDQIKREAEIERFSGGNEQIAAGLTAISAEDPSFGPKNFLEGAKAAYEMIVTAFAAGDRKTLKSLLDKDVYDGFESAISDRESQSQTIDFTFVGLPKIEITEAELEDRTAQITIRFNAEVVSATRDKQGELVEGDAENVVTIADEWTFARSTRARDPNWKLVATNQVG